MVRSFVVYEARIILTVLRDPFSRDYACIAEFSLGSRSWQEALGSFDGIEWKQLSDVSDRGLHTSLGECTGELSWDDARAGRDEG